MQLLELTNSFDVSARIKILENQNIVSALLAHVIETLSGVVHEIHHRTRVMSSDVIGFHEVLVIHGAAVANCKRPIFN